MGEAMPFEEKSAWLYGVLAVITYSVYVVVILQLAQSTPLVEVAWIAPMLWAIGASIAGSIVLHIVIRIVSPRDAGKKDLRDRQIYQFGEYVGQSFVVIGGVATLILAMVKADYFWIGNVVYLCFTLSAILGTIAKVVAYRRGFQPW
jgi:hypothetical protein